MVKTLVCPCGNVLRPRDAGVSVFCFACGHQLITPVDVVDEGNEAPSPPRELARATTNSGLVVFGVDPPSEKPREFRYRAVVVADDQPRPRRTAGAAHNSALPSARARLDDLPTVPDDPWGRDIEPADPRLERLWAEPLPKRKRPGRGRSTWSLEKHWYQALAYPFRAWPLVVCLGLGLTWLTGMVWTFVFGEHDFLQNSAVLVYAALGLFALAYTSGFFVCVLVPAAHGHAVDVRWPGGDLGLLARSLVTGVVSFLAGPLLTAAVAVHFWRESADLIWIDQLILLELGLVTVGYWLLAFLAMTVGERWQDAMPHAVFRHARRLGPAGWLTLAATLGILLLHVWWGIVALEITHRSAGGWLLLACIWIGLLFWTTFLLRWLGICWYRNRGLPPGN